MLKRICVVVSSLSLAGALVWHRATEGPPPGAMSRSKSMRGLEIYSGDFTGPVARPTQATEPSVVYKFSMASNPDLYSVVCSGSKHMGAGITVGDFPNCQSVFGLIERP